MYAKNTLGKYVYLFDTYTQTFPLLSTNL